MFDIGFTELLLLTVIGVVVIGPERLPSVARTLGRIVGQARRFMTGLQNKIEQEIKLDELNKRIMEETKDMNFDLPTIHNERKASHKLDDGEAVSKLTNNDSDQAVDNESK